MGVPAVWDWSLLQNPHSLKSDDFSLGNLHSIRVSGIALGNIAVEPDQPEVASAWVCDPCDKSEPTLAADVHINYHRNMVAEMSPLLKRSDFN